MNAIRELIAMAREQGLALGPAANDAEKELAELESADEQFRQAVQRARTSGEFWSLVKDTLPPRIDLEALRKALWVYRMWRDCLPEGKSGPDHALIVALDPFLTQLEGAKDRHPCPSCAGFKLSGDPIGPCEACAPKPDAQTCPRCAGSGVDSDCRGNEFRCGKCNGTGKVGGKT